MLFIPPHRIRVAQFIPSNMSMLERQELLQLDPISNKGTLQLLPLGKKNKVISFFCISEMSLHLTTVSRIYSKNSSLETMPDLSIVMSLRKANPRLFFKPKYFSNPYYCLFLMSKIACFQVFNAPISCLALGGITSKRDKVITCELSRICQLCLYRHYICLDIRR